MSTQNFARQFENLGNLSVVPNTTSVVELNVPLTVDRAVIAGSTLNVTGAAVLSSTLSVAGILTATGGIANGAIQNALTALSGGGQAGATQLKSGMNRVTTVAALHDSCALPAATAGVTVTVTNQGANGMDIYPLGATDVIEGIAVQTPMLVGAGFSIEFRCIVAGTWDIFANGLVEASWSTGTTTTTFTAGQLTGGGFVVYTNTGATPGSIATRTATQMFNDMPGAQPGMKYILVVNNTGAGTLTMTAGSGVTLTGTATVAQNVARWYIVTFTTPIALVIQEMFSMTSAA